jgi:hypothetical protein
MSKTPQHLLSDFYQAVEKADAVKGLMAGRQVEGIAACVAKLIGAERQRAAHILAAADRALAELEKTSPVRLGRAQSYHTYTAS